MMAMSDSPLVTVVIPTVNRLKLLKETVASVIAQTYSPIEIVVSDNSGCPNYGQQVAELTDDNITVVKQDRQCSMTEHANRLSRLGNGEFWLYLPDDDLLLPKCIERLVYALESQPSAGFAFCDHWIVDNAGRHLEEATDIYSQAYGRSSLSSGIVPHERLLELSLRQSFELQSMLFRISLIRELGFDLDYDQLPDFDLQVRAALRNETGDAVYVAEKLTAYRFHDAQFTVAEKPERHAHQLAKLMERVGRQTGVAERARQARLAHAYRMSARYAAENGRRWQGLRHLMQAWRVEPRGTVRVLMSAGAMLARRAVTALAKRLQLRSQRS